MQRRRTCGEPKGQVQVLRALWLTAYEVVRHLPPPLPLHLSPRSSYGTLQMTLPVLSWRRRSVEGHPRPRNSWGDAYSSSFLGRVRPREPNGATKKVVAAFALIQSVECFFLELELGPPLGFPGIADGARGTPPPMCPGNLPSLAQHRIDFGSRIPFHHLTSLASFPLSI